MSLNKAFKVSFNLMVFDSGFKLISAAELIVAALAEFKILALSDSCFALNFLV